MSKKKELKNAIAESERKIEDYEKKRSRSEAALIYAIVNNLETPEADKEIFNLNTQLIELERKHLVALKEEFDALD